MRKEQRCRNDDIYLLFKYWELVSGIKKEGEGFFIPNSFVNEDLLTNPKTIFRVRRYLQKSLGEFLPTDPKIIRQRKIAEKEFRKFYKDNLGIIKSYEELVYGIR